MEIKTDNKRREILYWFDLTPKEQEEHKDDYDSVQESSFVRYRGYLYDLGECMALDKHPESDLRDWDGYWGDTYFSSTICKTIDSDWVIMGRAYC